MTKDLFSEVKNLSLEIRSLIRQGVREGVEERIQRRNQVMQDWFAQINSLIEMTGEQQDFLEALLQEEQSLLTDLQLEQKQIAGQQRGQQNVKKYLI